MVSRRHLRRGDGVKEKIMPNYLFAYHGGRQPESPEEGARQMARWKAWIGALGNAAVNPGTPLGASRFVSAAGVSDDSGQSSLSGFSIVEADSMETALEIARDCPYVDIGTIEVAEVKQM